MRIQAALVVTFCLSTVGIARADGLLYRLPEDGTWARYGVKQIMEQSKNKRMTVVGTLKLASVGQEKVDVETCRWIEIVIEANLPGEAQSVKSVFKALIPEKRLAKGEDPLGHSVKGWVKLGDQAPQALTKELLSSPALMINLLVTGPLKESKNLEKRVIETKLGKLACEGVTGSLTLKGAAVSVKDDKVTTGDVKLNIQNYLHDKAPFGVVTSRLEVEYPDLGRGKTLVEADLTLLEVGAGTKSELPEQK